MVNVQSLIVPVLLFIVLSPGLFLQLPPQDKESWFGLQIGDTSLAPIFVHALVFAILLYGLKTVLPQVC
jgi:hypothetical protein